MRNNGDGARGSLLLGRVGGVEFEKDDVSVFHGVVSSLLSVFTGCL